MSEQLWQQAGQVWSVLDDLSVNDPAAYRTLMEKQMKEGAEFLAAPELHAGLSAAVLEPKKFMLYINVCCWKRVPAPPDPSSALPIYAGKLETGTDEDRGEFAVLDVAVNPAVLQECEGDHVKTDQLFRLALSYAQQQHGMKLSQQYNVRKRCPKSSPDELYHRLGFLKRSKTSRRPDAGGQMPAALLQQMSALRSEEHGSAPRIIWKPAECIKKDLIQVISSSSAEPQKPEYQLEVKMDPAGVPRSVELVVELPKVRSVSECQLSVSEDDVLLDVEDVYHLLLEFPKTVNEDTASAIFNKKKRQLLLKVDILVNEKHLIGTDQK
ncbi:PIH1 domain-containing protein 2 [Salarias fasciatus]|uniref:PIH1 domain-containing protein 2 n=1 Tax=Salarias fasciatus TaxID=181472 RepID=A0A672FYQ8_SALFA|nr:PIH1 domain-containing protein 2 [Salarias fasciatus]